MNFVLKLSAKKDVALDPRISIMLAWALLVALADLLRDKYRLTAAHALLPSFSTSCLTMAGQISSPNDFLDSMQDVLIRLSRASALINASENLLQSCLVDRLIKPNARFPVPVAYIPKLAELLSYNEKKDLIQCQAPDWAEIISPNVKVLKALANIYAAGLTPALEVDGVSLPFAQVSPSIFDHGFGAGHSLTANGSVTGMLWHAGEIEILIDGFRDGRILRAQLSEGARLAAMQFHPPYTVAVQFYEPAPLLPMLPHASGKVVIERMWDFRQQTEFDFS